MKRPRLKVTIASLLFCLALPPVSSAKSVIELTPGISVSEQYDDNIFLDHENEESDYITAVSASIDLDVVSERQNFFLHYSPTYAMYSRRDDLDTLRHYGSLSYWGHLSQHLRLNVSDTFLRSEEPLEGLELIEGVRETRDTYWRNVGQADLSYEFGPEDHVRIGYSNSVLENNDITLVDGTIHEPFADLAYWFNLKSGIEVDYSYISADFQRDDPAIPADDYEGLGAGARYIHRFTQHTSGFLGYSYAERDFEGATRDYDVHTANLGFSHAYSADMSVSLSGGYFVQERDRADDETGLVYQTSLLKKFERGQFMLEGQGGWDEAYLEAERRGFTRFWSWQAVLSYRLFENVNGYLNGYYRQDENEEDQGWRTWRGRAGLAWSFLRWLSLGVDYTYMDRNDDVDTEDYKVNRIMLTLTATELYRW